MPSPNVAHKIKKKDANFRARNQKEKMKGRTKKTKKERGKGQESLLGCC